MNPNYIAPVHFQDLKAREPKRIVWKSLTTAFLGWTILQLIMVISQNQRYQSNRILGLIEIAALIVLIAATGINISLKLCFNPQIELGIDHNSMGFWIWSSKYYRYLFLSFDLLENINQSDSAITFSYTNALYVNRKGNICSTKRGQIAIFIEQLNSQELQNFVSHYNKLVPSTSRIKLTDQQISPMLNNAGSGHSKSSANKRLLIGLVIGISALLIKTVYHPQPITTVSDPKYTKTVPYHAGMLLTTRDYRIKIKQGYLAKAADGSKVAIFHVIVRQKTVKTPDSTIFNDSFYLANTLKRHGIDGDDNHLADSLDSATIVKDGLKTPIINLLHADGSLVSSAKKVTFNLAFNISNQSPKIYLVYSPFTNFEPQQDDDRPKIYIRFNKNQLKELR